MHSTPRVSSDLLRSSRRRVLGWTGSMLAAGALASTGDHLDELSAATHACLRF